MKIAILGGGNGAYAAAADLSEQGHEVRFWRRDTAALAPPITAGSIHLKDVRGGRDVAIARITPEIGVAVRGADLILLPGPATSQSGGLERKHLKPICAPSAKRQTCSTVR